MRLRITADPREQLDSTAWFQWRILVFVVVVVIDGFNRGGL